MKRWWLWSALGTVLLLVAGQRTWVTGTWHDPVLGTSLVEATGTEVASSLTAGALLAGAALLAGLVGSRPVRLVAAICLAGGALLAGGPALLAVSDPQSLLDAVASQRPGAATLSVRVADPTATAWPWIALLAALLVLVGAVFCALVWFRRGRAGAADGSPDADNEPRGSQIGGSGAGQHGARQQQRARDPWDDLTQGEDPTVDRD